jgi:hypothetical protein
MTTIEALIIVNNGWNESNPIAKRLYEKTVKVIKDEYDRIYLEAQKKSAPESDE